MGAQWAYHPSLYQYCLTFRQMERKRLLVAARCGGTTDTEFEGMLLKSGLVRLDSSGSPIAVSMNVEDVLDVFAP